MTTAHFSTVLDAPVERVWSLIRDFNNYPAYIEGVTASEIEDGRRGDEEGAVRRFCYRGLWVRQRLTRHSDRERTFSYAGLEPLPFPKALAPDAAPLTPVSYEGTLHVRPVTDGERTFVEWSVALDAAAHEAESWRRIFDGWIPEWTASLRRNVE
ncbi:MAG: SRPBCC family protein [Proteobacteria bacterium]|nr:SRPBCC family protein [Pseudomonadota bacterium]